MQACALGLGTVVLELLNCKADCGEDAGWPVRFPAKRVPLSELVYWPPRRCSGLMFQHSHRVSCADLWNSLG